jgi:hypothetical protein
MTAFPPSGFSLIPLGTKIAGHVNGATANKRHQPQKVLDSVRDRFGSGGCSGLSARFVSGAMFLRIILTPKSGEAAKRLEADLFVCVL